MSTSGAHVLKKRNFLFYFLTQLTGAFNDNLFKNAVVILIAARGLTLFGLSPEICITLASGIFILPFFFGSAFAGQISDKYSKSSIIRYVKAFEIVCMLLGILGFHLLSLPLLVLVVFGMGLHSAVFGPVKYSILPQILREDELLEGNALVETGTFLAILGGTILGGFLVLMDNGPLVVGIASLAVAILGYVLSLLIPPITPVAPELVVGKSLWKPTRDILQITGRIRSVFLAVLGVSWFWFYGAFLLQIFPVYVKGALHADDHLITVLLACFCVGTALGSLLVEKISGKNLEMALVPIGSFGMSVFCADLALMTLPEQSDFIGIGAFLSQTSGRRVVFDLLAMSAFGGFFTVPLYTMMQQRVPKPEQSRVVAGNNIYNALFMVGASLLLGIFFAMKVKVQHIFLFLAVINACVALYIFRLAPEFTLRFIAWIISRIMYRREVIGHDNIPRSGGVIVVCNHVSFVDWLVVGGAIRRPTRFVMDHRIFSIPFLSSLFKLGKTIPIAPEKENKELKEQAFARIHEELKHGEVVCIFPEGRITHDGEMNRFMRGIERALGETPVPVVPMALHGLWGSLFSRKDGPALQKPPRRFRARLTLLIGEPVPPEKATAAFLETEVRRLLVEAQRGGQ